MWILDEDGIFSSIISKGHRDLQFTFSSLLLVGNFISNDKNQNNICKHRDMILGNWGDWKQLMQRF